MRSNQAQGESGSDLPDLPVLITAIKPQKQRKDRYSLFHESTFLTGITAETMLSLNIATGMTLTRSLLNEIEKLEQRAGIKSYLLRLLARRDHARSELETKAKKKGFEQGELTLALDRLEEKGYIDDESFAKKFIADKLSLQKWGPKKIENELMKRGVSRSTTSRAIEQLPDNWELNQICVDLAVGRSKRFLREDDPYKRKQKIISFLLQRGFRYETINKALPDILLSLDV